MSELIKCKTCEKPLSSTASVCPHCGEEYSIKKKQKNKSFHPITKIFIIVTVILLARQFLFPEKNTTGGYKDNTSSSNSFLRASSNLWTGVKLYYGPNKEYVFDVVGGNDNYKSNSGEEMRGLLVKYPSGNMEWKDRNYIIKGDKYWVKNNDPALKEEKWMVIKSDILE
jgi:hypothetical protein